MDQEINILSEVKSERQIPYDITYMWNLKYDTNELIYETDSDIENKLMDANYYIYRMDKQGPTVYHRELHSISCDKP